jgi:hypothetical protein
MSRDLMSRDSASANRVAEEVYPTPWCWISFLLIESSTYNNANSIPRYLRDGAMRSGWTDNIAYYKNAYKSIDISLAKQGIELSNLILINLFQI